MARIARIALAFGALGILTALVGIGVPVAISQDQSQKEKKPSAAEKKPSAVQEARPRKEQDVFMRQKLDASNRILEGLLTENSEMIAEGAKILVEMSSAEQWQVRHDPMYKQFSGEFQQSARKLLDAAEKDKPDEAALKWIDTTLKCIDCHKFVRGTRIAGNSTTK